MSGDSSKFNAADIAVFGTCELIAIPLAHTGWEAVVGEEHFYRGLVALAVGIPLGLIGVSFHWWKNKIPPLKREWLRSQANRWWPAAALIFLIYFLGPSIYFRAAPSIQAPTQLGRVSWNFEQSARGFSYFLGMIKPTGQGIKILGFQAHGQNNSSSPIAELSGYIRSDLTNVRLPIYLLAQDNDETKIPVCSPKFPTLPEYTFGIPGFAEFDISTYDKSFFDFAKDGVPSATFLANFSPFTVILEYDKATYSKTFSKDEIKKQIDMFEKSSSLESIPRVVRKENAPKPALPPLSPLVSQQATPLPPLTPLIPPQATPVPPRN